MATTERDVKLMGKSEKGEILLHLPFTRLGNIQPAAAVKESPAAADFVPLIDSAENGQMKKTLLSAVKGKRTARFIVGTSAAGWTQADCDYLCDGEADDVELNAAVQALPDTGGEILLLDGTYQLTAPVAIDKNSVTLTGNGQATILKRMFANTAATASLLYVTSSYNTIRCLRVDGNKANFAGYGVYLSSAKHTTVADCFIVDCSKNGLQMKNAAFNIIQQNTLEGNTANGLNLTTSTYNSITGNIFQSNGNTGIYLFSGSDANVITKNYCLNGKIGISITSSDRNTLSENHCIDNTGGIVLTTTSYTLVIGNTCLCGTGLTTDYTTAQATIKLQNTSNNYCLIAYNNIPGKDYTGVGGTNTTLIGNKFE